jgi:hypothetical protein
VKLNKKKKYDRNEERIDALEDTSPRMKNKLRIYKSEIRAMKIVLFDMTGVMIIEWVPGWEC